MIASPVLVTAFWREAGPDKWFKKDAAFDDAIRRRFLETYEAAAARQLGEWENDAEGVFALLLVLDQFPRNMYRGDARTYASDALARAAANRAIDSGLDARIDPQLREFLYLPFMLGASRRPVALYRALAKGGPCRKREMGRAPRRDHPALQPLPPPQPHPGTRDHARGAGLSG